MTLTTIVLLVVVLYVVQLSLQETTRFGFDLWAIMGNRDNPPEMSILAARFDRAKNNMLEALPIFLALALLSMVKGNDTSEATYGASTFLIARAVYVPAYVSGVPIIRSLVWLAGNAGLVIMALPLI